MYFETKKVNVLFSKDENIKEIFIFIKMILCVWCVTEYERGWNMEVQCLNIISKKFYPTKRVTDGLLLLLPIKGVLEIQQFTANVKIDTEVLIVNHTEIFSIKRNETTILLYIASDWFLERGYSFFDYQYNSKLIQSTAQLTKSLIELTKHYLNHTLSCDIYENYMVKIVEIIANEAKVDSNYLPQQTDNSYFGITGEILDYVSRNLKQPLTLKSIANHIFISQSNISSQFYSKLDMNFKTYVDTLKLATSMKELLNGQYTIGEISDLYGFSSAALYSKKFKQYYGYTPNQYRKLTKYNKNLYYPYETLDDTFKDQVKSQLTTKLANSDVQNNEITICSDYFSDNRNSSIIIQIYTITELYQLYTDPKMSYLIENDNQVYIYCNINVKVFQKYISEQQTYKAIDFIIKNNAHLVLQVYESQDIEIYLNQICRPYATYLQTSTNFNQDLLNKITYCFDLSTMPIKEIYRNIIKIRQFRENVKFGIDITQLFNEPDTFKMLEVQLNRIGFDYYCVDNQKLSTPNLNDTHEMLLTKEIFKFNYIRKIMSEMCLEERHYFLLNVRNNFLVHDESMNIIESPPLLVGVFKRILKHFSGIGVDLIQQMNGNESLYLYDKSGFRTLVGSMFHRLIEKTRYKVYEHDFYTIIDQVDKISVYISDWQIMENEVSNRHATKMSVNINFKDLKLRKKHLIFKETYNNVHGNINCVIPGNLREKYQWSDLFIEKIEAYNKPLINVFEHPFNDKSLSVAIDYNTVHIIDIYK